jgi:2-dehydro-3-deoxyphosphogluconate aldolase/(4S)-4-hydroxy-2-oxoglutarate aldolase
VAVGLNQLRPFPAQLPFCTLFNEHLSALKLYQDGVEWNQAEYLLNLPSVAAISIHKPQKKQLNNLASGILE